ncbi:MAG: MOSC domain-containing protein [Flavobacteriaceae bacterium]
MKVIATNVGKPTPIEWNGKKEFTGIFKYPVEHPIFLEKESVANDTIANRKVHGGIYKACYLFSADQYPYWKEKYPELSWDWGMFGENLTVEGLDEALIRIGNIYKLGEAVVQITQPREPCYKLGVRFDNQQILKEFIDHAQPGAYVRVVKEGEVTRGDSLELIGESANPLTVKQFYELLFAKEKNPEHLQWAIDNSALPERKRSRLKRFL